MEKIEKIEVVDDFLEEKELQEVAKILNNIKWDYGHTSITSNDNRKFKSKFWASSLDSYPLFSKHILNIIEKHFFKKFELKRVYANCNAFGYDGEYHEDDTNDDTYTFCLYINKQNKEEVEFAGGNLYFKFPELKYQICFEPWNNRGIFFPSKYTHKGVSFKRHVEEVRISIAWKLREIKT